MEELRGWYQKEGTNWQGTPYLIITKGWRGRYWHGPTLSVSRRTGSPNRVRIDSAPLFVTQAKKRESELHCMSLTHHVLKQTEQTSNYHTWQDKVLQGYSFTVMITDFSILVNWTFHGKLLAAGNFISSVNKVILNQIFISLLVIFNILVLRQLCFSFLLVQQYCSSSSTEATICTPNLNYSFEQVPRSASVRMPNKRVDSRSFL